MSKVNLNLTLRQGLLDVDLEDVKTIVRTLQDLGSQVDVNIFAEVTKYESK